MQFPVTPQYPAAKHTPAQGIAIRHGEVGRLTEYLCSKQRSKQGRVLASVVVRGSYNTALRTCGIARAQLHSRYDRSLLQLDFARALCPRDFRRLTKTALSSLRNQPHVVGARAHPECEPSGKSCILTPQHHQVTGSSNALG